MRRGRRPAILEPMTPQETALASAVRTELDWDRRLANANVRVQIVDGVLVLLGQVSSYEQKCAAARAAARADGAEFVHNRLEVVLAPESQVSDSRLRRLARQALEQEPLAPVGRITIGVRNGLVTLRGMVDFPIEREASSAAVRRLPSIVGLRNELTLRRAAS